MKNIIEHLEQRGLIDAMTSHEMSELMEKPMTVYIGFDPTSDSLHIGNLVGMVVLGWFQRFGHKVVAIVGGATGMIGDPSGKSIERNLLDAETLNKNVAGIRKSLEKVVDFESKETEALLLNNFTWFQGFRFIDFLRDVGKHFRIGTMLGKESVRSRLTTEEGLSYTEFSYQLLQAYDFLYLSDKQGVNVQMGGSDQWGNITAGCELVRKMRQKTVFGMTFPLLTRSDGKKFGKTEEGAIWLNEDKLSAYDFYQYLFRLPDADVITMMRMLTFMELKEIEEIEKTMGQRDYVQNSAQERLASEVTLLIHGESGLNQAQKLTKAAAPGATTSLDAATLEALAKQMPSVDLKKSEVLGVKLSDLLVTAGLQSSKSEARRLIQGGGAYLNNEKVDDANHTIAEVHFINNSHLLLGVGKKKKMVVRVSV